MGVHPPIIRGHLRARSSGGQEMEAAVSGGALNRVRELGRADISDDHGLTLVERETATTSRVRASTPTGEHPAHRAARLPLSDTPEIGLPRVKKEISARR